jgi:hypothetical protein
MGVSKVFVDESKVIRPLMVGSVSRKYSTQLLGYHFSSFDGPILVETKWLRRYFGKLVNLEIDKKKVKQEVGMEWKVYVEAKSAHYPDEIWKWVAQHFNSNCGRQQKDRSSSVDYQTTSNF